MTDPTNLKTAEMLAVDASKATELRVEEMPEAWLRRIASLRFRAILPNDRTARARLAFRRAAEAARGEESSMLTGKE